MIVAILCKTFGIVRILFQPIHFSCFVYIYFHTIKFKIEMQGFSCFWDEIARKKGAILEKLGGRPPLCSDTPVNI